MKRPFDIEKCMAGQPAYDAEGRVFDCMGSKNGVVFGFIDGQPRLFKVDTKELFMSNPNGKKYRAVWYGPNCETLAQAQASVTPAPRPPDFIEGMDAS